MAYGYDYETAERRVNAYVDMLKASYQVDEYGLADMLGIHRQTWTKNRKACFKDISTGFLFKLASLTGLDIGWLIAEDDGLGEADGIE